MDLRQDELLRLTPTAAAALAAHFAGAARPSLRVFLSFLSEAGPRLELSVAEPQPDDVAFSCDGWRILVNRRLLDQAAPLTVDCDGQGIAIASSLDFSQAGGDCGGACGSH
ncbi:hypothetical protein [Solidesulfovibrio sp.]|uniref:hypothetical protein n=1 Tax=Solidesulfovibrio sp. TaxID=2910990 RepID=UPI002607599E|nr:hypothetical protein [Solidesulfovibrio sp.]